MKTLGILGGMGPGATVSFLEKVVRLAGDDWPRIILEMDPSIPSRTLAAMGKGSDCGHAIHAAIYELEAQGADVIAVPCNSAHAWYPHEPGSKWLHMPVVVSDAMKKRGIVHPLIVGGYATVNKGLYEYFDSGVEYLNDAGNKAVYQLIADIKKVANPGCEFSEKLSYLIARYCGNAFDAVLLACTELSIIWPVDSEGACRDFLETPVIDSSWEYAKAIMRKLREG